MVSRFLDTLSNALGNNQGPRAAGVKRRIEEIRDAPDAALTTSRRVLDARLALGADDAMYLQTGLSLLWAGDDNRDQSQLLYPSSMGSAGITDSTKRAVKAALADSRDAELQSLAGMLKERINALMYILSLPEVYEFVEEEMRLMNESSNPDDFLTALSRAVSAKPELSPLGGRIGQTITNLKERLDDPTVETIDDFMAVLSVLRSIFLKPDASGASASLMEVATLYEQASVDIGVARDYSLFAGIGRSARYQSMLDPDADAPASIAIGYGPATAPPALDMDSGARDAVAREGCGAGHPPRTVGASRSETGYQAGIGPRRRSRLLSRRL